MNYNVNNDTIILRLNLEKENGKVSVASQRYYPCKVYKDYDEDNYVIVPYAKKYNGGLEGEETVSLMKEAYDRIIKIYGNRMILPLPYTTVKKNKGMSLLPDVSNQFRYIKENII